jgi:hypothetical protein
VRSAYLRGEFAARYQRTPSLPLHRLHEHRGKHAPGHTTLHDAGASSHHILGRATSREQTNASMLFAKQLPGSPGGHRYIMALLWPVLSIWSGPFSTV